jgi:uncharacterized membrane protein YozB (DUF420 family)
MNPGIVILILQIATVTVLWLASLIALSRGNYRLHGRINIVFFILTLIALIALELVVRLVSPGLFDTYFQRHQAETAMFVHLCFSVPSACLLFLMLFTGLRHKRQWHVATGLLFALLWTGTFITGIFFLPVRFD